MYDIFKDIVLDSGGKTQGLVAFFLSFIVFSFIMVRAWRARRDDEKHVASLPLNNDTETSHTTQP
ncbi:hypothetical protein HW115_13980 [Verrucomicrobiaceae bacterium N1E253]|uniref:CcoQ/FixQ family Cbb3-type cytochrome c oxidase assembly chaperone n=1 Tax=Oceaniferula marina TaxID=2748318 RepID=A0A851GG24_9BACT|nr:hypothetical protein [Oceaniferula marina]NWK56728.1 hypothetical protein [Oceaniferula marina]